MDELTAIGRAQALVKDIASAPVDAVGIAKDWASRSSLQTSLPIRLATRFRKLVERSSASTKTTILIVNGSPRCTKLPITSWTFLPSMARCFLQRARTLHRSSVRREAL